MRTGVRGTLSGQLRPEPSSQARAVPRSLLSLPSLLLLPGDPPPLLQMLQNWKFESQAPSAVSCILLLRVALVEAFLLIPGVSVEQPRGDLDILLVKREVSPRTRKTPSTVRGQTCPSWNRTEICCRLISSILAAIFYLCQVLFLH